MLVPVGSPLPPHPRGQGPWPSTGESAEGVRCPRRRQATPTCLVSGQGLDASALSARLPPRPRAQFAGTSSKGPHGPQHGPPTLSSEVRLLFPASGGFPEIHSSSVLKTDCDHCPGLFWFLGPPVTGIISCPPPTPAPGLIRLLLLLRVSFLRGTFLDLLPSSSSEPYLAPCALSRMHFEKTQNPSINVFRKCGSLVS